MQSAVEGTAIPVVGSGQPWCRITSRSCPRSRSAFRHRKPAAARTWGGVSGASWGCGRTFRNSRAAGLNYVVSTGGAAGTFTCGSTAGMESFIARLQPAPHLVGIDFDIEGGQSQSDIQNSGQRRRRGAQSQYPKPAVLIHPSPRLGSIRWQLRRSELARATRSSRRCSVPV